MESGKLVEIGFSNAEARVYLILLELGRAQAGIISKKTQINRTTTYDLLERLLKKGLITYTIQASRKIFMPVNPKQLVDNLKEQEKLAAEILPGLNALYKISKEKEEFNIYHGRKGIKSILQDILN